MARKPILTKIKKIIAEVADQKFAEQTLKKELPKIYPDFKELKNVQLKVFKNHFGRTSAVFVVEYLIKYLAKNGETKDLDLFVSAHSDGSRESAFKKTKFLYEHGFNKGKFRVIKPLFFIAKQKAFFYEASKGNSLFSFFHRNSSSELNLSLKLTAGWVQKLHSFDTKKNKYAWPKFDISRMIPKPKHFVDDFAEKDKALSLRAEKLVNNMIALEKKYQKKYNQVIIYGDYHPENIIINGLTAKDLEMIDFTDLALGDPMMDLGTFIQQFDFMGQNFMSRKIINKYKKYFLEAYFNKPFNKIDTKYFQRINLYQAWTALRTVTFLFYMGDKKIAISDVLEDCQNYLLLAESEEKIINLH